MNVNEYKKYLKDKYGDSKIYSLVFGFEPEEGDYTTSPFRKDYNPGAYFAWYNGYLRFIDFANPNKKYRNINCFDAVKYYYNINSFKEVLTFIEANVNLTKKEKEKLIRNKSIKKLKKKISKTLKITILPREWSELDKKYWFDKYRITKKQLEEDEVFPITKYAIVKIDDYIEQELTDLAYAYTDFKDNRKKIYRPYKNKKQKWISNVKMNDIGGKYNSGDSKVIITKSYKDYRVLKNQKFNVRWFQNEGALPNPHIMYNEVLKNKKRIIIFFDNDKVGKESALLLKKYIRNLDKSIVVKLFFISDKYSSKDISDCLNYSISNKSNNFKKVINELRKIY